MKLRFFLTLSMLGATAGSALADDEPAADGAPAEGTTALPSQVDAPATLGGWAQIGTRSLVLPAGKMEAHASLGILALTLNDGMGNSSTETGEILQLGGTYGVSDKLEVGIDYAFSVNEFDIKGPLAIRGAYAAYKKGKLELAIAGQLNVLFTDSAEIVNGMLEESTDVNLGLSLGAWARYSLSDKLSLFSGQPATPVSALSAGGLLGLPPLAYQLSFGFNNNGPSSFALPLGVGFQATPEIYAYASTTLFNVDISNSANSFIFADNIPLGIGAFYTVDSKVDLGLSYTDDLKSIGDFFIISLTGRYYLK